jgi:RNA polymerase sigma factor (sigma-70 family)
MLVSLSPPPASPPRLMAWRELISQHDRAVVLSLLARGVRLEHARELAHEAWARLYEQETLGRLNRVELPGLAIAQASFLAAQEGRRARKDSRHGPLESAPELGALADGASSAEERLVSRQALQKAREVVSGCSSRAQEVFMLAYEHPDQPQAHIAARVGLSVQRVRQILWEVRGRIRAALEESSDA